MQPIENESEIPAEWLSQPHYISHRDGVSVSNEKPFDAFWDDVAPLLDAIISDKATLAQAKAAAESNITVPVMIREGESTAAGLVQGMRWPFATEDQMAMVGFFAAESRWPDLTNIIDLMEKAAKEGGGLPVIVWSPQELPPVGGYVPETASRFSGTTLVRAAA